MVEFTQFVRPNGRPRLITTARPDEVEAKAVAIKDAGFELECEVLMSGHASFTIADHENEEDVAIEVVMNGPKVPEAIDRLIMNFDIAKAESEASHETP